MLPLVISVVALAMSGVYNGASYGSKLKQHEATHGQPVQLLGSVVSSSHGWGDST